MKKGVLRMLALACVLALGLACATMLTACGDDDKTAPGEKFTYSKTTIESDDDLELGDMMAGLTASYDTLYKDSTLEVTDSKVIWTMKDQKAEMTYTKDGDKMILAGDFADTMKEAFKNMNVGMANMSIELSMYGLKTDAGFEIVVDEKITTTVTVPSAPAQAIVTNQKIRMQFVKA